MNTLQISERKKIKKKPHVVGLGTSVISFLKHDPYIGS
jgi:hypothetical protein